MCILGGGFGGLYTALRLESLDWPEGKKPQVTCDSILISLWTISSSSTFVTLSLVPRN